jgi:hypothetical protein
MTESGDITTNHSEGDLPDKSPCDNCPDNIRNECFENQVKFNDDTFCFQRDCIDNV